MNYLEVEEKMSRYIDAGFPILYLDWYDENNVDKIIENIITDQKVIEWNMVYGLCDFIKNKSMNMSDLSLVGSLRFLISSGELENALLVLKDIHRLIEDAEIIALLKNIAESIDKGIYDCNIIIVAPIRKLPKELEPYTTLIEMSYLSSEDIKEIITEFIEEMGIDDISNELLQDMSIAFKGLSQYEINNILALSYADNGELTKQDLSLIFEQKRQMIMKS